MKLDNQMMLRGPLLKNMIGYTIPIILTGWLQLLFNAADLVVVGQANGSNSLAAVGATGAITNLIVNLFMGLSVGAGVMVAHGLGGNDEQTVHRTIHTAIPAAAISGLFLTVVGVGLSILFSHNASSGGLDIVAKILNKYFHIDLGKGMSAAGVLVSLSSALCYDSKIVVLSVLGTYFGGIVLDHFIFGINIKRRVCVISSQLDSIVDFVLHELHSGATLNEIIGAYDKTPKTEMITIVDKNEYRLLMDFIHKTDPKAFVTVYSVSDMRYLPKK